MGKSPAKWIKTKLFGKKLSGSAAAKERGTVKLENDNDVKMVEHREKNKSAMEHSSVLQPTAVDVDVGENLDSMDGGQSSYISAATDTSNPVGQAGVYELKEVQAATKVQAALRGYLARRAFQALGGIIRLQAMIRGHLVRKQAIATLQCMQGIVKMQAIVRGNRIRCSDIGLAVRKVRNQEKPADIKSLRSSSINSSPGVNRHSTNAFVQQLLAPACTTSALRFHYSGNEPNSAANWLERWMLVRVWEPSPLMNKSLSELDLQENQSNGHHSINYAEYGWLKRSMRRFTSTNMNMSSAENMIPNDEKSRRNLKKLSSSATMDQVDEHQLSELEKVKRSLRKVSASMTETTSSVPDVLPELSKRNLKIVSSSPADVPNQSMDGHEDNVKKASVGIDILDFEESALKQVATNVIDTSIQDKSPSTVVLSSLEENAEVIDVSVPNGGVHGKGRHMTQENQKTETKRFSLSAKLDENGVPVTPTLPRYMAATESAKAKLQAQGSPSSVSDISDKNIITRRHSLPSAANGKVSSPSLRAERQFQTNGKSVGKNDRSFLSSPGSESPERKVEKSFLLGAGAKNFMLGSKRGFSDAIDGPGKWVLSGGGSSEVEVGKGAALFSPRGAKEGSVQQPSVVVAAQAVKEVVQPSSQEKKPQISTATDHGAARAAKAQVVGWPPIRSFRKNTMASNTAKNSEEVDSMFVKVSMDGAPYLRKVDLKTYTNYKELSSSLEKMFSCFTIGQCGSHGVPGQDGLNESCLRDLLHGSEYVLTYEDKDGDWMLVGDVPWDMFTGSCKRLRIMKGTEAIGLAPKSMEKCKSLVCRA